MDLIKYPATVAIVILLSITHLNAQLCDPGSGFPQPSMTCSNAPVVCDLLNYCSSLPNTNEFQDIAVTGCPGFNILNNPAFFSFIATGTEVHITVIFGNCTIPPAGAPPGIQMAILTQCPVANGYLAAVPGTCFQNCSNVQGSATIGSSYFNIGKQYWFVVDGCSGSSCEFQIVHTIGADYPRIDFDSIDSDDLTGLSLVCPGQTFIINLNIPINACNYLWNSPFIGDFVTSDPHAVISVPAQTQAGSYTVCLLDGNNFCNESLVNNGYTGDACFTFEVEEIPDTEIGPFQICLGDSYIVDGQFFTPSDTGVVTYTYKLTSPVGCDSTIHLTLNVTGVDDEITWTDTMLIASQSDAKYQWIDCGNGGIPIDSATSQSFVPQTSGSYQVLIIKDGCLVYSDCIEILILSNGSTPVSNPTFFYPNPANEFLHFELNSNARIIVHNIQGSVLIENDFPAGRQSLDVSDLRSGTYIAKVYLKDKVIVQKIILQR